MQSVRFYRLVAVLALISACLLIGSQPAKSQSKPQRPVPATPGTEKRTQRNTSQTEEERKKAEEEKKQAEEEKNAIEDKEIVRLETNVVNVDAVVYNKKSGQIITGLKKENFAIFENGVKQEITNFATPESPITVTLVVEYSKLGEALGYYASRGQEDGKLEVVRPVAYFLSKFIQPPNDYASVIAFDIRPTPITDFTNDPNRLRQTVDLLLRNNPAFRETNLFDALKFALVGGHGDSVVLENSRESKSDYGGMVDVQGKRRAIILVASGIDTLSRINYDEARKVVQNSGIPIYVLSTGNLYYKLYESQMSPMDGIDGSPGRLAFLQAQNTLNTFAKESGGQHFPITFEGEIPSALQSINNMLRNQYSLAYDPGEKPHDGKKYKIEVKVDVNGDGQYEGKDYVVQNRPFYIAPNDKKK